MMSQFSTEKLRNSVNEAELRGHRGQLWRGQVFPNNKFIVNKCNLTVTRY